MCARYVRLLPILFLLLFASLISAGQSAAKSGEMKSDYSKEAFVDEEDSTKVAYENDGTGTREVTARIRIQSEAGVQRYSVLTFSYQQSNENIYVDYVRVRKPNGSLVVTDLDNVQDMAAELTREAPFYSDLHEKHVAVKGLSQGDVLEMHVRWQIIKPLALGQ